MAEKNTNIRLVLDNLLQHPMLDGLTLERAVNYAANFINIVGVPRIFEEKTEIVIIEKHKGLLPCDFGNTIQVRIKGSENQAFRHSSDSFHMSESPSSSQLTYKIQGGYIITSIESGEIEIAYEAIATDTDGFPLIPDNSSFTRALEAFIKKQWFTILFDMGKIQQGVLQNAQVEYAWAVGDCQTEFNRLSLDKAESFFNSWNTLLIRASEHRKGFVSNGAREHIKVH